MGRLNEWDATHTKVRVGEKKAPQGIFQTCDGGLIVLKKHWYPRLMALAQHIASWSKDPSTQCGAIIVNPYGTVVSTGYNGFPRGISDTPERYADRGYKLDHTIHAEINAVISARCSVAGHTLFVWPMLPCVRCATVLIQSDIAEVVSVAPSGELAERWGPSIAKSKALFAEAGVIVTEI